MTTPLAASSGTMGRSPRFMGISFSLDTNARVRLFVHDTRTPNDPLTAASFTRKRVPDGKGQGYGAERWAYGKS